MGAQGIQWATLAAHWLHVVVGAIWVGTSFYITSWENKLNRRRPRRDGVAGHFWTLHGGSFYFIEKWETNPPELPVELHLFKYEAYLTWITGFFLLSVVFYLDAQVMIDPTVADLSAAAAIIISVSTLVVTWLVYHLYCKTSLACRGGVSASAGIVFLALVAYFLTNLLSQRAAVLHVGAVIGTVMAGNVFFVIIPWHRRLVEAIQARQPLAEVYASRPNFRSVHNHYMTLPVFFMMLAGHFPVALEVPHAWLSVTALALGAGLLKHVLNLRQRQQSGLLFLIGSVAVLALPVVASVNAQSVSAACGESSTAQEAYSTIITHCAGCHSSHPTDDVWKHPPNNVRFDTPDQVIAVKERVLERVVRTRTMPPADHSGMRPADRNVIRCWLTEVSR